MVARTVLGGDHFRYFHDGTWKDGYYDRSSTTFVGVKDEIVTTVIKGATESYIANLKAGTS
jgi:hypothetical protein